MTHPIPKICDTCRWADEKDEIGDKLIVYYCKRYPPQVVSITTPDVGVHTGPMLPLVEWTHWCGEWVERPKSRRAGEVVDLFGNHEEEEDE